MLVTGEGVISASNADLDTLLVTSQLACLLAAIVTAWVLRRLYLRGSAPRNRPSDLHRNDSGATATMDFLLVMPPLMIIVFTVVQLAMMSNAQLHVAYSAYAAARSASTIAFLDLAEESEGEILARGSAGAQKWRRISRAAIPGTLAISPGSWDNALSAYKFTQARNFSKNPEEITDFSVNADLLGASGQLTLLAVHRGDDFFNPQRLARGMVKAGYAGEMTRVLINGQGTDEDVDVSDGLIEVTVEYDFWLSIPYAGAALMQALDGFTFFPSYPTITLSHTVTMPTWPKVSALDGF